MKTKLYFIAALSVLMLSSCKKDEKKPETTEPKKEIKKYFSVEVDVESEKDDNFPLYFTEDGTTNFSPETAIWNNVEGKPGLQTIVLDLSEEKIPTVIRIDFGVKKGQEQGDITLHNFRMSYYDRSFDIKGSDFLKYFIPNDSVQTQVDQANGTIKFLKNPKSKLDRFYYPQQTILDEIKKMTN